MRKRKLKEIHLSGTTEKIHKHGHHGGVQALPKFFHLKFAVVYYSLIDQVQIVIISVVFSLLVYICLITGCYSGNVLDILLIKSLWFLGIPSSRNITPTHPRTLAAL